MTPAEIIAEAQVQLTRKGWSNETMKMRQQEGPRCVGLVVADVCWDQAPHLMTVDNTPRRFVVAAIRERAPELHEIEDKALIIDWNDHYCTGLDEALEVLKRAEELARAGTI